MRRKVNEWRCIFNLAKTNIQKSGTVLLHIASSRWLWWRYTEGTANRKFVSHPKNIITGSFQNEKIFTPKWKTKYEPESVSRQLYNIMLPSGYSMVSRQQFPSYFRAVNYHSSFQVIPILHLLLKRIRIALRQSKRQSSNMGYLWYLREDMATVEKKKSGSYFSALDLNKKSTTNNSCLA